MLAQFFENSLTIIVNIYIIILFITGALSSTDPSVFDQEASLAAQEARSTVSTSGMKKCLVGKIMQNTPHHVIVDVFLEAFRLHVILKIIIPKKKHSVYLLIL